jgi:hypothetical protein
MMLFALVVFVVVLAVFALDYIHRTPAALAGEFPRLLQEHAHVLQLDELRLGQAS